MDETIRTLAKKYLRDPDQAIAQQLANAVLRTFTSDEGDGGDEEVLAMLRLNSDLETWHVYTYHHIDFFFGFRDPDALVPRDEGQRLTSLLTSLRARLIQAGWEGDGTIDVLWLPPFAFSNPDTYGGFVWHVKQVNNGTSWIASPAELEIASLDER